MATVFVQTALDAFGQVDIVVNNAGILQDKTFHNMTADMDRAVIDVHLLGAFNVTRPAWVRFREQGYGRVVNTSSNSGLLGNFGQANYGAAKMGLVGFTHVLAPQSATGAGDDRNPSVEPQVGHGPTVGQRKCFMRAANSSPGPEGTM